MIPKCGVAEGASVRLQNGSFDTADIATKESIALKFTGLSPVDY